MPDLPPLQPLDDAQFRRLTAEVLQSVEATVDRWLDEDVVDIDSQRQGGLLELTMPDRSKVVLNTQPPLHELWMASKAAGQHFKLHADGRWRDTRDGQDFFESLSAQVSAQSGQALTFQPPR